jgi:hypothetical protein
VREQNAQRIFIARGERGERRIFRQRDINSFAAMLA